MNQIIIKIISDGGSITDAMAIGDFLKKLDPSAWEIITEINSPGSTMEMEPTPKRITTPSIIHRRYY